MKTALITGATSGFGAATARRFAAAGWQVVGTGRRVERLAALADELGKEKVVTLAFDVQDAAATEAALASLPDGFKGVDLLVNNAGLALGTGPAQQANLDDWRTMIETNITSLVTVTRLLLPTLIERKGTIVNISSTAATYPYPGGNVYGGTKSFVTQFSLGLRSDLHGTGVRVTSIEPGMAETEFSIVRTGGNKAAADAIYKGLHPITPVDIAETLYWVATQPPHLNVNRIELMPVSQSWGGFQLARDAE
ncbi:MAG: SDR family NAD(P)-dependent oxidoreductase [Chloroflexi bacterium]|nr:SDR family NAD(P)-dependent oxidoreductase [Chloroflexota bacterium]